MVPAEIKDFLQSTFGEILSYSPCSGGCINNGGRISTKSEELFVKWNSAVKFPQLFSLEEKGLELLRRTNTLDVPAVRAVFEGQTLGCLVMEFSTSGVKSSKYSEELGHGLAALHKTTASYFGLNHNNYIGSLRQSNNQHMNWVDFFKKERIQPQVNLAIKNNAIQTRQADQIEAFCESLDTILPSSESSLIHGDLWGGNVMVNAQGNPVLIDPAVSFSNREMDIAMTQLFGGFDSKFYDAYNESLPMDPGWQQRLDIFNLYPLLVHVNLFGEGYLSQVMQTVNRYK